MSKPFDFEEESPRRKAQRPRDDEEEHRPARRARRDDDEDDRPRRRRDEQDDDRPRKRRDDDDRPRRRRDEDDDRDQKKKNWFENLSKPQKIGLYALGGMVALFLSCGVLAAIIGDKGSTGGSSDSKDGALPFTVEVGPTVAGEIELSDMKYNKNMNELTFTLHYKKASGRRVDPWHFSAYDKNNVKIDGDALHIPDSVKVGEKIKSGCLLSGEHVSQVTKIVIHK